MDPQVAEGDADQMSFQSFFKEADELSSLIARFKDGEAEDRLCEIFEKYQEQPELLDPHLEQVISPLMEMIREEFEVEKQNKALIHRCFKVIYILSKVRGHKTIVKFLPHAVSDLEPAIALLLSQDPNDFSTWHIRYGLLLWLSMIVLIPFDLKTADSSLAQGNEVEESKTLIGRLVNTGKSYLSDAGPTRDVAGIMLARLFSRPDMHTGKHEVDHLSAFLKWANDTLNNTESSLFLVSGVFGALANIFRHASRDALMPRFHILSESTIGNDRWVGSSSGYLRKLWVKLTQRIALVFLKPIVAPWRYQRGNRSLMSTLAATESKDSASQLQQASDDFDDFDPPEELESIIQHMLDGLRDKDTVVRWSAAKGVGRITMRLPSELADDIVGAVLDLFSVSEGDNAWHGGCLALAELARRGLLLPERLDAVVPLCIEALVYDVRKGQYSVGSHVRDAACYVCWAFARAYAPNVLQPYVGQLARQLLTVAVFDREVNCRRAAAAAFQENVGRQGNFPHGIDINTTADYFSLGNRVNAYTEISDYIAQYPEYTHHLIDHLAGTKIKHWDIKIRELSAVSLRKLTHHDPDYISHSVLPLLVPLTVSTSLWERHGSCLAIAELVHELHVLQRPLKDDIAAEICDIVRNVSEAKLLSGKGGAVMRVAVLRLIECLSLAKTGLSEQAHTAVLSELHSNLGHPQEAVQDQASKALSVYLPQYVTRVMYEKTEEVVTKFVANASNPRDPHRRRGACLALGQLPKHFITPYLTEITHALVQGSSTLAKAELNDAETRRNAVTSLAQVVRTVGVGVSATVDPDDESTAWLSTPLSWEEKAAGFDANDETPVFEYVWRALLLALDDYGADNRGDVGSWVREAAMKALSSVAFTVTEIEQDTDDEVFKPVHAHLMVSGLVKQLMEKMNRIRGCAGTELQRLVASTRPVIKHIPHKELFQQMLQSSVDNFNKSEDAAVIEAKQSDMDWSSAPVTFPAFVPLLQQPDMTRAVFSGLIISVGGLTESVVRHSSDSLKTFMRKGIPKDDKYTTVNRIGGEVLHILQHHKGDTRVIIPLFKTLDLLLSEAALDCLTPDKSPFASELIALVKGEIRNSPDIHKVLASINIFLGLLPFPEPVHNEALLTTLRLLSHRFPKVRRMTADEFYTRLITYDDVFADMDDQLDEALEVLATTAWDGKLVEIKKRRDELYPLFGKEVPARPAPPPPFQKKKRDESLVPTPAEFRNESTYKDFILSMK